MLSRVFPDKFEPIEHPETNCSKEDISNLKNLFEDANENQPMNLKTSNDFEKYGQELCCDYLTANI